MHWLAERTAVLRDRARAHARLKASRLGGAPVSLADEASARQALLAELRAVVEGLRGRDGLLGAFVSHEGLLVEGEGDPAEIEAAAAMAQHLILPARQVQRALALGEVQQLVVVGEDRKLVLIQLGDMSLGLIAPAEVVLGERLAR